MAQLYWSLRAQGDLIETGEFVARDSVLYAVNLIDRIIAGAEKLQSEPMLGRVVPEYQRADLREVIVRNYRVVYVVRGKEVIVARVVHGARDLRTALGPQPWVIE